jgi:hypothetical protein
VCAAGVGHQGRARAWSRGEQIANLLCGSFQTRGLDILGQHRWCDLDGDDEGRFIIGKGRRLTLP